MKSSAAVVHRSIRPNRHFGFNFFFWGQEVRIHLVTDVADKLPTGSTRFSQFDTNMTFKCFSAFNQQWHQYLLQLYPFLTEFKESKCKELGNCQHNPVMPHL